MSEGIAYEAAKEVQSVVADALWQVAYKRRPEVGSSHWKLFSAGVV